MDTQRKGETIQAIAIFALMLGGLAVVLGFHRFGGRLVLVGVFLAAVAALVPGSG